MIDLPKLIRQRRPRLSSVLGLTLDGSRLDGVVVSRAGAGLEARHAFSVSLSLDPLTNAPDLVGREIRNHLDAAGVRERNCVVGLPLKWALTTHVEVPELPEADVAGFLHLEAERGFPCDIETLLVATSRCRPPAGRPQALLAGVPRNQLATLESVLQAAKLKPVSFSLGITALQPAGAERSNGVLALAIGETHVALQITCGGGAAALRMLEGALEAEGAQRVLHADIVAREARITLGQLPPGVREAVRRIRVFGPRDLAQQLADEMELRFEPVGLTVEVVTAYGGNELGARVAPATPVTQAFSLAAERIAGPATPFEFLPPKVTALERVSKRFSSGPVRTTLTAAGAVGLLVGGLFFYQQWQIWSLETEWTKLAPTVKQLDELQGKITTYRPWYDESVMGLTILRCLTTAFPEEGTVTAKTVEIREVNTPNCTVSCTGTARTLQALNDTIKRLRLAGQNANLNSTHGQPPALQFAFSFLWSEGGPHAN